MYTAHDVDYAILKPKGCSYLGSAAHACGSHTLVPGTLYCEEHYAVMYQKGTAYRKRHKDMRRAEALRQLVSDFNQAVEELEAEGFDCYGEGDLVVEELT
jgi:hypothetical protein